MPTATAVIGANWGDEGKGLLIDHLATPESVVVRYNGGAQAGHTVVRDGHRHVFHHFGSGSLKGAATFLSRYFIHNPILYFRELALLDAIGVRPSVMADTLGVVSTPFDMMLNQMIEMARGGARHGSCGIGINETIKRTEAGYSILVGDLTRPGLADMLGDIRREWVPQRLEQLDLHPSQEWKDRLASDAILAAYLEHCDAYRQQVAVRPLVDFAGNLLFEGAQGLLLDEDHYFFPHVTHSHTGLRNVVRLAEEAGIDDLTVIYATRAYATRHGAGPFPREVSGLRYEDATNLTNPWQGTLRFGDLDCDLLQESITRDLAHASMATRHGLAITCLDQVGATVSYWLNGVKQNATQAEFGHCIHNLIGSQVRFGSFGASADFIVSERYASVG